jgi:leader peptidase (prepilin peptidase)/N-methyltransferase
MEVLYIGYIALVGLSVASFIGSLSYRVPRNLSILWPPSYCVYCKRRIKPYDLIPLLSFLALRGRCRYCGARLSLKYVFLELCVPALFVGLYLVFGFGADFFFYCYLEAVLIYLSLVDIEFKKIGFYDVLPIYAGGALRLILAMRGVNHHPVSHYLYGAAAASVLLGMSYLITFFLKKERPLGEGDLFCVPGVACYFGFQETVRFMIFSSLIGIAAGIFLISTDEVKRGFRFPMLPYIAGGVLIEIFLFQ